MSASAPMMQGQPVQYVAQQPGVQYAQQPAQYAYEQPGQGYSAQMEQPGQVVYMDQGYAAQPAVFNISPEKFAQLAQGVPMGQDEIAAMLGGDMVQAAPAPATVAAPAAAIASKGEVGSKKKMKVSKKKAKGCC
mmetsp:Transcript_51604/g.136320  ORF Transcript_51604/g.136320 Transcript_51604/m.136320 type:complete len:134 (+) Transcript_51604:80-481(+)